MEHKQHIRYFPITLFSSVMGFAALTIAVKHLEVVLNMNHFISSILLIISSLLFIVNGVIFLYRYIRFKEDVQFDFNHPLKMNFFPAISISLLLLSLSFIDLSNRVSLILWFIGAGLQLILTIMIITKLMWRESFQMGQFTPVSFIPIVGNVVVPIAGSFHVGPDINWFFYSVGMILSLVYLTIFINRLFFQPALPQKLWPTLFILLAPPSVGFIAYMNLTDSLDVFAYILYGFAFFIGLFLLVQLRRIVSAPFGVPWWSLLFPSAAVTIATMRMYLMTESMYYLWIAYIQMAGLVVMVVFLTVKTIQSLMNGTLSVQAD